MAINSRVDTDRLDYLLACITDHYVRKGEPLLTVAPAL